MPVGNKPVAAITGSCPNHHARDQLGQRPEQGRRRWYACATRRRLKIAPVERIDRQQKRVQKPLLSLSEKRERSGARHNTATIHHPGAQNRFRTPYYRIKLSPVYFERIPRWSGRRGSNP